MDIHNLDCFDYFKKVADKSVNLFVLDLPYTTTNWGKTTNCKWDTPIDLDKMWIEIKRIMKPNAVIIFFCNTKFGFNLIESNKKWFKYDLIWKKSRKVGFLSANKMPLRQHENIYVFKKEGGTYNPQMEEGEDNKRDWTKTKERKLGAEIYDKDNSIQHKPKNNNGTRHPTSVIELEEDHENIYVFKKEGGTYNPQMEEGLTAYVDKRTHKQVLPYGEKTLTPQNNGGFYHPTSILELQEDHENIYVFKKDIVDKERHTYNSQKIELDKPITLHRSTKKYCKIYENKYMKERTNTKTYTDEHPTDILEFSNPSKSIHKTQKPVDLLEWLIKSYSNEGDLICDFTMGSGSTAIACLNTNRIFTGCERDIDIFKLAEERIKEHNVEEFKKQQEERKEKEIKKKIKEYKKFIKKHTT